MIYRRANIGNIKDVAAIILGDGNVGFANIKSDEFTGIALVNVSEEEKEKGFPVLKKGADVVFIFKELESIEVLEEYLAKAKSDLLKLQPINNTKPHQKSWLK